MKLNCVCLPPFGRGLRGGFSPRVSWIFAAISRAISAELIASRNSLRPTCPSLSRQTHIAFATACCVVILVASPRLGIEPFVEFFDELPRVLFGVEENREERLGGVGGGDGSKIPSELETAALAIIVATIKPRIMQELSSTESANLSDARQLLRDIAAKKFDVSTPDEPEAASETTQSSGGCALVRPARGTPQSSDYDRL